MTVIEAILLATIVFLALVGACTLCLWLLEED